MVKREQIKICEKIIEQIKDFDDHQFFICNNRELLNLTYHLLDFLVKKLSDFGLHQVENFDGHVYCFNYNDKDGNELHGKEYNQAKINHIKKYIKHLKA